MKRLAAILPCLLSPLAVVAAQEVPPDQVPRLPSIGAKALAQKFDKSWLVARLQARFAHISSYSFAYHLNSPGDPGYFTECWKELGDTHSYEFEEPSQKMHDIHVYDGTRTSLWRGSGDIHVTDGESLTSTPAPFWQTPLDLYAFLHTDNRFLSMKLLRADATWKGLAGRIDYGGTTTFLGCECFVLRVRDAFSEVNEQKATYEVFVDTATAAPLGWQAYDAQGFMIDELALVDPHPSAGQPDGGPLPFAPHFLHTQYQWSGTITDGATGKVIPYFKSASEESFDEVKFNALKPADLKLNAPGAEAIVNEDTNEVTRLKH